MTSISEQMDQFRVASSVNMLGHSVLVPGNIARADDNGEIHGVIDLERTSLATQINFADAETGEMLHSIDLGSQASGMSGFAWKDLPEAYRNGARSVRMDVSINYGDGPESLTPNVFADVIGASATGAGTLEVEDYGNLSTADILRFRL